jgi:hypothetical protein
MKWSAIIGIALLTAAILYGELRNSKQKKTKAVVSGITLLSAAIALTLLFKPHMPGPSQLVGLLFGGLDKLLGMK